MADLHIIDLTISKYGLLFTKIRIDDREANTLIDLGDPNAFQLSTSFVEKNRIQIKKTEDVSFDVQGNTFDLFEGELNRISIASVSLENVLFLSGNQELEYVSKEVKTRIDAVIGWGFFKNYNMKIDYRKQKLIFSKSPMKIETPYFEANFENESSYLILKAKLDSIEGNLILDTGSVYSVIDSTFFRKHDISCSNIKVRRYIFFSLIFKRINTTLGSASILIDYLIYDLPQLARVNGIGILGGTFLQKFVVNINPENQKIYFRPNG